MPALYDGILLPKRGVNPPWLGRRRRLMIRWEEKPHNNLALVYFAVAPQLASTCVTGSAEA